MNPEHASAFQPVTSRLGLDVRDKRGLEIPHGIEQTGEVVERRDETGTKRLERRLAGHYEQPVAVHSPEHRQVGAERRARLTADRRGDLVGGSRVETRCNPQDPIERAARLALALVQLGALECLAAEVRRDQRDRLRVVVQRLCPVEEEAHRAHHLFRDAQRHRERRLGV